MSYRHLVLVSIDTLRSDAIAANPLPLWPEDHQVTRRYRTDALDRLVAEGAFFPHCMTAAPYTSAAHASILTGQLPYRHGVFEFFNRPLRVPTLLTRAKAAGYRTLLKVDFPITLGSFLGFDRGVDRYIIEDDEEVIRSLDPAVPSVSLVHFGGVHIPYGFHNLRIGGAAYRAKVDELEAAIGDLPSLPKDQVVETYRDPEDLELLLRYKRVVEHHFTSGGFDVLFELYLEGVEHFLATRFTSFLDALRARLPDDDWLLVVFGDHGEEYDDATFGHFNSLVEGVLRVPLLLVGPGVVPGTHLGRARTIDLVPTLLEAFPLLRDSGADAAIDGASLGDAVWRGQPFDELRPAICQAWIPARTDGYIRQQQELLRTNAHDEPIPHVLYKEAAYEGEHKLIRQRAAYTEETTFGPLAPCEARSQLLHVTRGGRTSPVDDPAVERRLASVLDGYERMLDAAGGEVAVPAEMRAHLRNMGYRL